MSWSKVGIFALGTLFGLEGIKILSSKDAKKVLSFAGVQFEAKWNAEGYKAFLENNGFEVKQSRQFASTIPLLYTECMAEK